MDNPQWSAHVRWPIRSFPDDIGHCAADHLCWLDVALTKCLAQMLLILVLDETDVFFRAFSAYYNSPDILPFFVGA